ncbi:sodium-dependent dicarboxylate transporter 2/3/5 [Dongia mobilis]|uniref:Sodium-dependent dicarboxylate transporter 2/3/5 n=1 Tax=Dongia mobilis TaxID=578943 RepID=A0A4R6WQX8_9PROT|nr:DASS family sodium-coupled anion symporter [Dongia mobilis]TDQ84002.1 sodium-dependent dicarboxylate transporter 2/3/5 [Dongia mobilis]
MSPSPVAPETLRNPVVARLGLVAGLAVLLATLLLPAPSGLSPEGWWTLGLALMMAIWWTTEPVPIGITALLPLIVLPLLGVAGFASVAAPYANPLVFLFLGGFLMAAGIRCWQLHRRLAHGVLRLMGSEPRRLVLGFMLACAFLSLWISNTAAVLLLLPVATSVIDAVESCHDDPAEMRRFALALLLGLAYSASIGGTGTLIGTPPNALLAGYLWETHGIDLSFAAWSALAMPLVIAFLPLAWLLLTRLLFPVSPRLEQAIRQSHLTRDLAALGPMPVSERRVAAIFCAAALLWSTRPLLNNIPGLEGLSDPGIALICAAALFLIPSGEAAAPRRLLTWAEAQNIPWQVLILFGGGLSLATAMESSGLAFWIGDGLAGLGALPGWVFLLILTASVVVLTELVSNTATVAALLPVVATIAAGTGLDAAALSAAVAMAASCAFMLPVATPPNALVFATGHVTIAAMLRAGLAMNVLSILLVTATVLFLAPVLFASG